MSLFRWCYWGTPGFLIGHLLVQFWPPDCWTWSWHPLCCGMVELGPLQILWLGNDEIGHLEGYCR